MQKKVFRFSNSSVDYYFEGRISQIKEVVGSAKTIFVTDENVFAAHEKQFKNKSTIVLKAGEEHKNQSTVDSVIKQLIEMEADRKTVLVKTVIVKSYQCITGKQRVQKQTGNNQEHDYH